LLESTAELIGVHIMVRPQRAQSVQAFTPTPAAVQFGTQAFAFVGTDPTCGLKEMS
jgi:hypothetical protein